MIWHKNAKPWTKAETVRCERMKPLGCIHCWLNFSTKVPCAEVHHIKSGNKRMGHWFTLPLCLACHKAVDTGAFKHAEQIDRWVKLQHILGLSDELPASKIFRRVA